MCRLPDIPWIVTTNSPSLASFGAIGAFAHCRLSCRHE
jgi:hypothetical protein